MPINSNDLKVYWNKFLISLLLLITSRKFWLKVAADIVTYQQFQQGAISAEFFLAEVLGSTATLIVAIAHEDAAARKAGR
jgi:hypothetical protein